MTQAELRTAIEGAFDTVAYAPPVSAAYAKALREHLLRACPGAGVDVYHRHVDVVAEVRLGVTWCKLVVPLP